MRSRSSTPHRAARGFALVSAIFLLVVLAVLGAFMAHFSSVQHITSAQDLSGSRAYQAAHTGIEWGTYQALRNSACSAVTTLPALGGSHAGFSIKVECTSVQASEGAVANGVALYSISSTASMGTIGGINYVERKLQALVEK